MISKDKRFFLENFANRVLFNNDMYKIPVDLLKIAENNNIKVYDTNFSQLGIPPNVSGAIRYKDNKFSIFLNEKESDVNKRFTLAHEIGHFFLDQKILKSSKIHVDTLYKNNPESSYVIEQNEAEIKFTSEEEIDYFAGALLMDEMAIRKIFKFETSIDALAKLFQVSNAAMTVRLNTLELI